MPRPPAKRVKVSGGLIKWSFGVGQEGVKEVNKIKDGCVIIDSCFPCWWTAAKAIGLNVLRIWLTSEVHFSLSHLKLITGDTSVSVGPELSRELRNDMEKASWLMCGGEIPNALTISGVWRLHNLSVVVTSKAQNHSTPKEWYMKQIMVSHSEVGGVTSGSYRMCVHTRKPVEEFGITSAPRQDLRSILKTGESGPLDFNMTRQSTTDAASRINYCGTGVIDEFGLLPDKAYKIKVRTQWRGRFWIRR